MERVNDRSDGNGAERGRLAGRICVPPRLGLALALLLGAALACGGAGPEARLAEARQGLADADYAGSLAAVEAGLAQEPDAVTHWGLELVKLEAHARAGHAEEALGQLRALMDRYPNRVPVSQYSATAHQLRDAGEGPTAIEVLDLGLKRHPKSAELDRLIGAAANAGVDSAELEMLRSLGYVD